MNLFKDMGGCGENGIQIYTQILTLGVFSGHIAKINATFCKHLEVYNGAVSIDMCTTLLLCTDILIIDCVACLGI